MLVGHTVKSDESVAQGIVRRESTLRLFHVTTEDGCAVDVHLLSLVLHFAVGDLHRARKGLWLGRRLPAVLLLERKGTAEEPGVDEGPEQNIDQFGAFALLEALCFQVTRDAACQVGRLAL